MIARSVWQPSIYQRVRLCANLLCFDLASEYPPQSIRGVLWWVSHLFADRRPAQPEPSASRLEC